MDMNLDREIDKSLKTDDEPEGIVKKDYRLDDDPGGKLGVLLTLIRRAADINTTFTLKDVEMLVRAAFVMGYGEAGISLSKKMEDEAIDLAASVNEYYTRFVADNVCALAGIEIRALVEMMAQATKEETSNGG
jgi:hypothetical protein